MTTKGKSEAETCSSGRGSSSVAITESLNQGSQSSPPDFDIKGYIQQSLSSVVPDKIRSDLPETNDYNKTIDEINSKAITSLINILENIERERLQQQKPLRNCLLVFVGIQMLFFNGVIVYMMVRLGNAQGVNPSELLDFLKIYMGGALAELIAMVFFITRSTFASTGQDIVKGLMDRLSK